MSHVSTTFGQSFFTFKLTFERSSELGSRVVNFLYAMYDGIAIVASRGVKRSQSDANNQLD